MEEDSDAINDNENPEWTEADFVRAKPFKEIFPEQYKAWKKSGHPPIVTPKVNIGFRLSADVVVDIRATAQGHDTHVEKVLRDAVAKGIP